jgi:hypothetical protein
MVGTNKTSELVDAAIVAMREEEFRSHLGASLIGRECTRQLWYTFRWARKPKFDARRLRIFDRGDREEERFAEWFEAAGFELWTKDMSGKQFRVSDCDGHFGGSLDGVVRGLPEKLRQLVITEFKTHNAKSFRDLVRKKVKKAKWEHYVQMNVYMYKRDLNWALYCAVNKDNDELYFEFVKLDKAVARKHLERAEFIVYSEDKPVRLSDRPTWYKCKMCPEYGICHGRELPAINCRTCAHATPEKGGDGLWSCQLKRKGIEKCPKKGCVAHVFNPNMLNGVTYKEANLKGNWIELVMPDGSVIKHGPKFVTSSQLAEHYK